MRMQSKFVLGENIRKRYREIENAKKENDIIREKPILEFFDDNADDFDFIEKVFMLSAEQGLHRKIVESYAFTFSSYFIFSDKVYKPLNDDTLFAVMVLDEKIVAYSLGKNTNKFLELPIEWISSIKQDNENATITIGFFDEIGFDKDLPYCECFDNEMEYDAELEKAENRNGGFVVFHRCFPLNIETSQIENKCKEQMTWEDC